MRTLRVLEVDHLVIREEDVHLLNAGDDVYLAAAA
jgi:hypothetical protein